MIGRLACVALLCCGPCLAADPAPAPGPVSAEAQLQFEQGVAAYEQGRYREAVDLFKEADRLAPSPRLSFNVAKVYERMQDPKSALAAYREYLRRLPEADNRLETSQRIAELELELQKQGVQQLTIVSTPSGATLLIDDVARGVTPWTGELTPGAHRVALRLREYRDATRTVELPARHAIDVEVLLEPPAPQPAPVLPPPPPVRQTAPVAEAAALPSWWTWALFGGSAGLLVGSGAFELSRRSAEDAAHTDLQIEHKREYDAMESRQTTARVLLGAGLVVGVVAGVSLYLDLSKGSEPHTEVGFGCDGDACGALARGRF
jgi:tetratricopeptide (TPR) repeat protein